MQVYLDNASTTRQSAAVTAAMERAMRDIYGNPSALHAMGLAAEKEIRRARQAVADVLGVHPTEMVFTGSGTESDNLALQGAARLARKRGNRIVTTAVEHPAVLETCRRLAEDGWELTLLPVDAFGAIDPDDLAAALDAKTVLISIMAVNNELGTVEPLAAAGRLKAGAEHALLHSDAVQAYGKIPLNPARSGIDLLTLSGHKIHGPKGAGALYVRRGIALPPLLTGGGQENGRRSGTENTPAIIGLGVAAEAIREREKEDRAKLSELRNYLKSCITNEINDVRVNSPEAVWSESAPESAPGRAVGSPAILNVSFVGCRGEVLLHSLEQQGIFVSTGSACSSRKPGSHVLSAIGLSPELREGAVRFSLSADNTIEEMAYTVDRLKAIVADHRKTRRRSR